MRWTLLLLMVVGFASFGAVGAHAAEPPPGTDPQLVRDHDRAIEIAEADRFIRDRLALRPGLEVKAGLFDFTQSPEPSERVYGQAWFVAWFEPDADDESPSLTAVVDIEREVVLDAGGIGLIVMPGRTRVVDTWIGSPWWWGALAAAFALCMVGTFARGSGARMLLPLAIVSAAFLVTLENVVPSSDIRGGNLALFGAALAGLLLGAATWTRASARPMGQAVPRWPAVAWIATWLAGIALQVRGALRVDLPIDVAAASDRGARLLLEGTPVYGNLPDVPDLFVNGDTYGPVAYLAYAPAAAITDDYLVGAPVTNVVLSVLVGIVLLITGMRRGSLATGAWMAAAWTSCPVVALGVVIGNNDVVVAAALLLVMLVLGRPAWRGALLAAAAGTKFLPALLAIPLLRLAGERRGAMLRFGAALVLATVVLAALALHRPSTFDEFWESTVAFQVGRIDIKSFWGLAGLEDLRSACFAAAAVLGIVRLVRWRTTTHAAAAGWSAAILALLIAGLPQYWGAYATWVVPLVLLATVPSAGRRAGALPSSTGPS